MIRYDWLQHGLLEAVRAAVPSDQDPTIVWAPSEYPRGSGLFIALRMLSGPDLRDGRMESLGGAIQAPVTIRVTCDAGTEGERGRIACNGGWWTVETETEGDHTELRDAWVEMLATAGHAIQADLTPVSTNQFDIDGTRLWSLYGFAASGNVSYTITDSQITRAKTADTILRCEIQVFSASRYPRGGAMDVATSIMSALELQASYDILDSHGISVLNMLPIVDLTTLSGAGWESRAALTLDVGMRTYTAEIIDTIDSYTGSLTLRGAGSDIAQEI